MPRTLGPVDPRHAVAVAVIVGLAYAVGPSVFLSTLAGGVAWLLARTTAERALALLLPVGARLALAAGVFAFEPPIQIVDLAIREVDPLRLLLQQDLWWPRYFVSYPAIAAMDHWGLRFADSFSLYCAALLPATPIALLASIRVWRRLDERSALAVGLLLALLVGLVATQMNGRLIPAHLGMALVLLAQARIVAHRAVGLREALLLGSGTILSHMTSGTGLVAYLVVVAGMAAIALMRIQPARVLAVLWLLSAAFGPLLYRDLMKNLDFYGGGPEALLTMLDHGPGVVLRQQPVLVVLALVLAAVAALAAWRLRRRLLALPGPLRPAALSVPVTALGGMYGYSALTMAIPGAFIFIAAAAVAWRERVRD